LSLMFFAGPGVAVARCHRSLRRMEDLRPYHLALTGYLQRTQRQD
jgi:hypothetical protein